MADDDLGLGLSSEDEDLGRSIPPPPVPIAASGTTRNVVTTFKPKELREQVSWAPGLVPWIAYCHLVVCIYVGFVGQNAWRNSESGRGCQANVFGERTGVYRPFSRTATPVLGLQLGHFGVRSLPRTPLRTWIKHAMRWRLCGNKKLRFCRELLACSTHSSSWCKRNAKLRS
jgi:hypothetical protein